MKNLPQRLRQVLQGRVCLIGVGQVEAGDDGFGVRLAEALSDATPAWEVLVTGASPEQCLGRLADRGFNHAVFLDAVDLGAAPGSVTLLDSAEMASALPQISTHRLSLGVLARLIEDRGETQAWLLGVQPESLVRGRGLSPVVQTTLDALRDLML